MSETSKSAEKLSCVEIILKYPNLFELMEQREKLIASLMARVAHLEEHNGILTSNLKLQRERTEEAEYSFKNFHRNLCKRFDYGHDEIDWRCDQASLEEHIADRIS